MFRRLDQVMLLYFIRHGQTDDNVAGVIQGQKDTPLNDHGRKEAALVSARMAPKPLSEIWSSSLSRASETAEIIAKPHGLAVQTHPGLMERGLGSLEGRRRGPGEALPADIEQGDKFRERIVGWFTHFLSTHQPTNTQDEGPICIVSHGAYITTLVSLLLSERHFAFSQGPKVSLRKHGCYNTSVMRVSCEYDEMAGRWRGEVQTWGDIEHLKGIHKDKADSHGHSTRIADDVKA